MGLPETEDGGKPWGGFLEEGVLQSLGSARAGFWLLRGCFLPCDMGMILAAPCIKGAQSGPYQHMSLPSLLTPSTGTISTEEPTEIAWGLEGPSLRPGQPSAALEDWEGESAWVQVLGLPWTCRVSSGSWGHMRRGRKLAEETESLDMAAPQMVPQEV